MDIIENHCEWCSSEYETECCFFEDCWVCLHCLRMSLDSDLANEKIFYDEHCDMFITFENLRQNHTHCLCFLSSFEEFQNWREEKGK